MAKADLGELLKSRRTSDSPAPAPAPNAPADETPAARETVVDTQASTARKAAPKSVEPARAVPKPDRSKAPEAAGEPLYRQLTRKEARLREDQFTDLATLAKRLQRAKGPAGDRITENTLIRVAVDLLLARADQAHGHTEEEILRSLSS
ncbi:conserved protein of unknown function (plasmid) [Agreia sp. COWG]|nr:conserved protein of unknown function [Agreia sp. COWG]